MFPEQDQTIDHWYRKATVRHTPRIRVPHYDAEELIYPLAHCAVCDHPLVLEAGRNARAYILTQAAYRFLYGVGLLETKFVIQCSLDLLHDRIPGISEFEKLQALTVVIDEGYHAHVALDFIMQMQERSGINPLSVPQSNRKIDAYAIASARLPEAMRADFRLLAVTLAENVLTEEIASLGRDEGLAPSFTTLMMDHVKDEGRHSGYFADLMRARWAGLSEKTKSQFSDMLPEYLDDFLGMDSERGFDRQLLGAVGLAPSAVEQVLADTNADFVGNNERLAQKTKVRLYRLLKLIGVPVFAADRIALAKSSRTAERI